MSSCTTTRVLERHSYQKPLRIKRLQLSYALLVQSLSKTTSVTVPNSSESYSGWQKNMHQVSFSLMGRRHWNQAVRFRDSFPSLQLPSTHKYAKYDSKSGDECEIQWTMLELLNKLDGFDTRGDVKVIMAINRIDSRSCAHPSRSYRS